MAMYSSFLEHGEAASLVLGSSAVVVGGILLYKFLKKKPKLPPGPRPVPLIGNMWGLY